jgi:hypothetical protein
LTLIPFLIEWIYQTGREPNMSNTAAQIELLQDLHFELRMEARDWAKARNEMASVLSFLIFKAGGNEDARSVVEGQKIYKLLNYELIDLESNMRDVEEDLSILRGEG